MADAKDLIEYVEGVHRGEPVILVAGNRYAFRDEQGNVDIHDTFDLEDGPARSAGTIVTHSADGFANAVGGRVDPKSSTVCLYADDEAMRLVAILNDDHVKGTGWRDYRVDLGLRRTPEWDHWRTNQGLVAQETFAGTIEKGLPEIVSPPAGQMLDLAQTFLASTSARFKQGGRLRDGRRQFQFEEDVTASAGEAGTVEIPEEFTLSVRPFFGSEPQTVTAMLKYRVREGKLAIGYELVRPHEVERAAFADVKAAVQTALGLVAVDGVAPSARS